MKNIHALGFTLIELMAAIMILAILSFIAAPNMSTLVKSNRLDSSATVLMRSMIAARSEAIARNQPVVICSSANGSSCTTGGWENGWISFADDDADNALGAAESILETFYSDDQLTIRSAASNPNLVAFSSDGSISEIVSFRVCGSDADIAKAKTISLSVTGRPRSSLGTSECP